MYKGSKIKLKTNSKDKKGILKNKEKIKTNLILFISIVFFLVALFLKVNYSSNRPMQPFGITILNVMSNSMNPTIKKGDKIIIKKQNEYEIGDIITYMNNDENLITHRIIEKYEDVFITKGDNNNAEDSEKIQKTQVLGKVISIL